MRLTYYLPPWLYWLKRPPAEYGTREAVRKAVIRLLADVTTVPKEEITDGSSLVAHLKADGDDLAMHFIPSLHWEFRIKTSQLDWDNVAVVSDIVDLVCRRRGIDCEGT